MPLAWSCDLGALSSVSPKMISYRHRQRVGVDRNNNLVMPTSFWNYQAMGASGPLGLLQCACVSEARDSRLIVLRRCNLLLRHARYWCWPSDLSVSGQTRILSLAIVVLQTVWLYRLHLQLRLHRKNLDARDVTLAVLDRPRVKPCVPFLRMFLPPTPTSPDGPIIVVGNTITLSSVGRPHVGSYTTARGTSWRLNRTCGFH